MKLDYGKVAKEYERYDLQNIGDVSVRRLLLLLLCVLSSICCLFLLVKAQNFPSSVALFSVQGEPTQLSLPFCIEDSSLVAMQIYSYDGPFWEDGSGEFLENVFALLICNTGNDAVLSAELTLYCDDAQLCFAFDILLPGESVLVPERNAQKFFKAEIRSYALNAVYDNTLLTAVGIDLQETGDRIITLTNLTESTFYNICIYYKSCIPGLSYCVGGKSFCYFITSLKPKECIQIQPYIYASGYSKILYISTKSSQ